MDDLVSLTVGGMQVSKQMKQMQATGKAGSVIYSDTSFLAFKDMLNGSIDAIFKDMQLLQYYAKKYPKYKITIVPYENEATPESQQVMMTKKDNTKLLTKLNQGIDQIITSGEMKKLEDKWLNNPNIQ
ncbi:MULTISPECIES: substrate-binding periplasmic protein [unclassified Moraxella]|uniref:substrate-binding periplasmic protein n=1 Tax=unclassified Moraxella TaxID=2685852 RepID=UPI003AF9FFC4